MIKRALAIGLMIFSLAACGGGDKDGEGAEAPRAALPKVVVAPVAQATIESAARFNAVLAAKETVEVRARVSGYLKEKAFEEGAFVTEGQVLYRLDDRDLKAALDKAVAETAKAKAAWDNDENMKNRMVALAQKGAVSLQQRDSAVSQAAESQAAWQAAKSAEETAAINLGYATIAAPTDGYVNRSNVEVGSYVDAGAATLMTTIYKIDPIRAEFSITDKDLVAAQMAMAESGEPLGPVTFTLEIGDDRLPYPHKGEMEMVDPVIDSKTNTLGVRALFPNPEHQLRPGLYVSVVGASGSHEVLTVPDVAIMDQGGSQKCVYVVGDDGAIQAVPVKTGSLIGEDRVVMEGLAAGQKVVVEGLVTARPGMRVEIVDKTASQGE